jgi:hypothetical protein
MYAARVQAMKSAGICLALLVVFAPCAKAAEQTPIESADRLFQSGEFAQAGEQYARIVADHPDGYSAILQLGRIALLSNRLGDAESWLKKAMGYGAAKPTPRSCSPRSIIAAMILKKQRLR